MYIPVLDFYDSLKFGAIGIQLDRQQRRNTAEYDEFTFQRILLMSEFINYMNTLKPGSIEDSDEVASLLADCWDEFEGGDKQGMTSEKLSGRMESVHWKPPHLTFEIVRHGGMALGSTRGERQSWQVNLKTNTATCTSDGHRQITPRQSPLNVEPFAQRIAKLILNNTVDQQLKWINDRTVLVLIGKIIPDSGPKETVQGRRKRFREALQALLKNNGWTQDPDNKNKYSK